jgi:hypothetical protein
MRIFVLVAGLCLTAAACGDGPSGGGPPPPTAAVIPSDDPLKPTVRVVAEVSVETRRIVTRLPTGPCIFVTATPIIIGHYAVFASHRTTLKPGVPPPLTAAGCEADDSRPALYAVSLVDGEAYKLADVDAQATATYADGAIILPTLEPGAVLWWQDGEARFLDIGSAGMDAAALWDRGESLLVAGTANPPGDTCQAPPNDDCGALFAVSRDGEIARRLDPGGGFQAWVTAGPTTDGENYFVGTGAGTEGEEAHPGAPACQVLMIRKELGIAASYADHWGGCNDIRGVESAVAGELPIAGGQLWAQYTGSTSGQPIVPVVSFNRHNLHVICRTEIPVVPWQVSASYHQAPVIDSAGRAYLVVANAHNGMNASLYVVREDCSWERLVNARSPRAGSPALADDRYVLFAADGELIVLDRETRDVRRYELGSRAPVTGSPAISEYGVTVVAGDGTVTTLRETGLRGYGSDPWPRFRRDNHGTAGAD